MPLVTMQHQGVLTTLLIRFVLASSREEKPGHADVKSAVAAWLHHFAQITNLPSYQLTNLSLSRL
jgi:hypothetical protein